MTAAREGVQYVEPATTPTVKARLGVQYIEVLVAPAKGGWSVGFIRIG